jgi:hypothetical protein
MDGTNKPIGSDPTLLLQTLADKGANETTMVCRPEKSKWEE